MPLFFVFFFCVPFKMHFLSTFFERKTYERNASSKLEKEGVTLIKSSKVGAKQRAWKANKQGKAFVLTKKGEGKGRVRALGVK